MFFKAIFEKILLMKIIYIFCLLTFLGCASKKNSVIDNSIISQKKVDLAGFQLVLNSVSNDSRCPEGTNCIWAGEVTIIISVYNAAKLSETKTLVLSSKNLQENLIWFQKQYPNQKIKSFSVLPYPKSDVVLDPKDYFIKIIFG